MDLMSVRMDIPDGCNVIIGHSHFIKTVDDLYEAIINSSANAKFGIAFCEASQECLIRWEGNDKDLIDVAIHNAKEIAAGHTFVIILKDAYPINVLPKIRDAHETIRIFCATANPLEIIVAETEQGRGVLGVIDGFQPKGVEKEEDQVKRRELLKKFGYKR